MVFLYYHLRYYRGSQKQLLQVCKKLTDLKILLFSSHTPLGPFAQTPKPAEPAGQCLMQLTVFKQWLQRETVHWFFFANEQIFFKMYPNLRIPCQCIKQLKCVRVLMHTHINFHNYPVIHCYFFIGKLNNTWYAISTRVWNSNRGYKHFIS